MSFANVWIQKASDGETVYKALTSYYLLEGREDQAYILKLNEEQRVAD